MSAANDWNAKFIAEFRANAGQVGGNFAGAPTVLITTIGRKSGRKHTTPTMYLPVGEDVAVFASKAGADTDPDWFLNLVANPRVTLEVWAETYEAEATVVDRAERDRLYAQQAALYPGFAEYEAKTSRVIPVVLLQRAA